MTLMTFGIARMTTVLNRVSQKSGTHRGPLPGIAFVWFHFGIEEGTKR